MNFLDNFHISILDMWSLMQKGMELNSQSIRISELISSQEGNIISMW